jgi:hypothetical protein
MKKLIAISVVFALVAGVAFAADVGAEVIGQTNLIQGDTGKVVYYDEDGSPSVESNKVQASGWPGGLKRIRVVASGEDDNGLFGGWFRFETYGPGSPNLHGFAWWKPIDQVKINIGVQPDGVFGMDGVTRWGFYQVGGDVGIPKETWAFGASFYQGWDKNGLWLNITPMEALEINLGIPYASGGEAKDVYMKSHIQVAYTADGIGKFGLTYLSGLGHQDADPKITGFYDDDVYEIDEITATGVTTKLAHEAGEAIVGGKDAVNDPGKLFLYVGLTMIEGLSIDVGLGYTLPVSDNGVTRSDPIAFGLGAHYTAGDFGVKVRTQLQFMGKTSGGDGDPDTDPMNIVFDVMPYYAINESLTGHFSFGVNYTAKDKETDDDYARMGFHATPYITIKSSWWAPNFYAGIDIRTDGNKFKDGSPSKDGSTVMQWSVPIGIVFAY